MDKKKQKQINELGDLIFKRINGANLDDISDCVIEIWNAGYRKSSLDEADYWRSRCKEIGDVASKKTAREILAMFDDRNIITWDDLKEQIAQRYGVSNDDEQ